jgi:hypothetical protein
VLIALVILSAGTIRPAVINTLRGDAAMGGGQGHHTGIDRLADYLNTRLSGEIIYDHWLGWELAYYLGESPQVITLYTPLPEALADDMAQQPYPRYFAAPSPQLAALWLDTIQRAGIEASMVYQDTSNHFVIYRLVAQNG